MKLSNVEKNIVKLFREEFGAKSIILVGSRAVGDFKENSDWDGWVFTDKKKIGNLNRLKKKYGLDDEDLDFQYVPTKQKFSWDVFWLKLKYSKLLYDPDKIAERVVEKALAEYAKGPKVSKEWALRRVEKAERYMKKFEDNLAEEKYAELFNRICWHYNENVIDWWFKFRKEWPMRPQQKFDYIKKKDPGFYRQLQKVFSDKTSYRVKIEAFRKIHGFLFGSKPYRKLVR
jgi:predicted nucleotidyltransferase